MLSGPTNLGSTVCAPMPPRLAPQLDTALLRWVNETAVPVRFSAAVQSLKTVLRMIVSGGWIVSHTPLLATGPVSKVMPGSEVSSAP